jgi:threonine dehydrogenase-like Zn-dependent dehydrogenase
METASMSMNTGHPTRAFITTTTIVTSIGTGLAFRERVLLVGQSFFDPLPAGADLYVLESILNDWPDREAQLILSRCAEAARPGGRIAILGGVVADDNVPSLLTPEIVLLGGKDRTLREFQELARSAGLTILSSGQPPSGRFAVECRPG